MHFVSSNWYILINHICHPHPPFFFIRIVLECTVACIVKNHLLNCINVATKYYIMFSLYIIIFWNCGSILKMSSISYRL